MEKKKIMNRTKDVLPSDGSVVWCFASDEEGSVPLKCLWLDNGGFYDATNIRLLTGVSDWETEYWMEIP